MFHLHNELPLICHSGDKLSHSKKENQSDILSKIYFWIIGMKTNIPKKGDRMAGKYAKLGTEWLHGEMGAASVILSNDEITITGSQFLHPVIAAIVISVLHSGKEERYLIDKNLTILYIWENGLFKRKDSTVSLMELLKDLINADDMKTLRQFDLSEIDPLFGN